MKKINFSNPLKFGSDIWDPSNRFVTSWCLTPWALFIARALISLYAFADLFFVIGWGLSGHYGDTANVKRSFSYFTVLCYWGIAFYFGAAAIHTFSYALNGGTPLLNRFPRPLQALHYLFWSTIVTYPFIVTIVYWILLYGKKPYTSTYEVWVNTSQHGLNSLFALFELCITRINPAPWVHLIFLIIILAGYLGVAYITQATQGFYVYDFLNPAPRNEVNGKNIGGWGRVGVTGICIGIAVGIIVIFCISKAIAATRKWATETKMGKTGKFYAGRSMGAGEVELETQRVWEK